MSFSDDPKRGRPHWRPTLGAASSRTHFRRVQRNTAVLPRIRRPHVWSYTEISPFDFEVHCVLFDLTTRCLSASGRVPGGPATRAASLPASVGSLRLWNALVEESLTE